MFFSHDTIYNSGLEGKSVNEIDKLLQEKAKSLSIGNKNS